MSATTLRLQGDTSYDVVVGHHLTDRLPALLGDGVVRVAVIHPTAMADRARALRHALDAAGFAAHGIEVPDGETAKTARVAEFCWSVLGQAGFTRSDAVVTLGGGSATDLGGFVAATWLRGVEVVHVPTTLLGMVDAAVGGKTGINTDEGKNLVGSFHHPAGVLCDLSTLETLPRNELVSGMAEVVKCGFIADPEILSIVERSPATAMRVGSEEQRELVERAIQVKLDVVAGDFKETGGAAGHPGREALNYGHTLGHAIERAESYRYRHGAAISIGMVFVAELARLAGRLDDVTAARHADLLSAVGLPTSYDGAPWGDLLASMRLDKKSRGDLLRFVVLEGVARPVVLEGPSTDLLEQAFAAVRPRTPR
ncbi:3-dehydroquinate synthase [Nocardioides marmoribigeumensis]|uniref:3-dehydroquinate synthase n=1 Tax=Nocardioides marmoribigeumensis TaxID=433649 RepID=A0ABU2BQV1_9ACTN|nr:3-dehydroquinate synthase [Nocardioides marmoribigeumensis]MDR7361006.1 3-dehydroquinate synthase [Nocardioides marmoribigeumensis]